MNQKGFEETCEENEELGRSLHDPHMLLYRAFHAQRSCLRSAMTELGLASGQPKYLSYLAVAVNNLRMTFDCDVIVGGYVGGFLAEFGEPLREMLVERNTFEPDSSYLKFSRYRLEASALGAALLHIEAFIQNL